MIQGSEQELCWQGFGRVPETPGWLVCCAQLVCWDMLVNSLGRESRGVLPDGICCRQSCSPNSMQATLNIHAKLVSRSGHVEQLVKIFETSFVPNLK